jgi:hypothetical protein
VGLIKRGALFRTNNLFRPFQTIKWQIKQNKQVEVFLMLLSSDVTRVIDSMYFFAVGRFGREVVDKKLLIFNDTRDGVSWITPWASCPGLSWSYASEASNQVSRRLLTLTY